MVRKVPEGLIAFWGVKREHNHDFLVVVVVSSDEKVAI